MVEGPIVEAGDISPDFREIEIPLFSAGIENAQGRAGNESHIGPVSYTHLDVYKRQLLG